MNLVNFKLDGKKVVLGGPSLKSLELVNLLNGLKFGEYLSTEGCAELLKISVDAIQATMKRDEKLFVDHSIKISIPGANHKRIWGSRKSIAKLKKELEA